MNDQEFVDAIKEHVFDSAIEGVMSQIISPSGTKPSVTLLKLNNWFHEQDEETQSRIRQCIKAGAHSALFGMLCVLDGVRLIHEDLRNGQLRLVLRTDTQEIVLSDNQEFSELHDIFNATEGVF